MEDVKARTVADKLSEFNEVMKGKRHVGPVEFVKANREDTAFLLGAVEKLENSFLWEDRSPASALRYVCEIGNDEVAKRAVDALKKNNEWKDLLNIADGAAGKIAAQHAINAIRSVTEKEISWACEAIAAPISLAPDPEPYDIYSFYGQVTDEMNNKERGEYALVAVACYGEDTQQVRKAFDALRQHGGANSLKEVNAHQQKRRSKEAATEQHARNAVHEPARTARGADGATGSVEETQAQAAEFQKTISWADSTLARKHSPTRNDESLKNPYDTFCEGLTWELSEYHKAPEALGEICLRDLNPEHARVATDLLKKWSEFEALTAVVVTWAAERKSDSEPVPERITNILDGLATYSNMRAFAECIDKAADGRGKDWAREYVSERLTKQLMSAMYFLDKDSARDKDLDVFGRFGKPQELAAFVEHVTGTQAREGHADGVKTLIGGLKTRAAARTTDPDFAKAAADAVATMERATAAWFAEKTADKTVRPAGDSADKTFVYRAKMRRGR